jgi:hypothetical protein
MQRGIIQLVEKLKILRISSDDSFSPPYFHFLKSALSNLILF